MQLRFRETSLLAPLLVLFATCFAPVLSFWTSCVRNETCFTDPVWLGCFENGPRTPYCEQLYLPESPLKIMPKYRVYTRRAPHLQIINWKRIGPTVKRLQFDASDPVWMVVHGFRVDEGSHYKWMNQVKQLLLEKNQTVILVDWSNGARAPNYFQATANTRLVGRMNAAVLRALVSRFLMQFTGSNNTEELWCTVEVDLHNVSLSRVTVLGFSLGAHVAGFTGKTLTLTGTQLGRIIALDPAGPVFIGKPPTARLAVTDANYVLVLHTSGESTLTGGAGTMEPLGHVDLYPNGGSVQWGCRSNLYNARNTLSIPFGKLFDSLSCSHQRAVHMFLGWLTHGDCTQTYRCWGPENWSTGDCIKLTSRSRLTSGCYTQTLDDIYKTHNATCLGQYFYATPALSIPADQLSYKQPLIYCAKADFLMEMRFGSPWYGTLDVTIEDRLGNKETLRRESGIVDVLSLTDRLTIGFMNITQPHTVGFNYTAQTRETFFWGRQGIYNFVLMSVKMTRLNDRQLFSWSGPTVLGHNQTLLSVVLQKHNM